MLTQYFTLLPFTTSSPQLKNKTSITIKRNQTQLGLNNRPKRNSNQDTKISTSLHAANFSQICANISCINFIKKHTTTLLRWKKSRISQLPDDLDWMVAAFRVVLWIEIVGDRIAIHSALVAKEVTLDFHSCWNRSVALFVIQTRCWPRECQLYHELHARALFLTLYRSIVLYFPHYCVLLKNKARTVLLDYLSACAEWKFDFNFTQVLYQLTLLGTLYGGEVWKVLPVSGAEHVSRLRGRKFLAEVWHDPRDDVTPLVYG